jgi:transposase
MTQHTLSKEHESKLKEEIFKISYTLEQPLNYNHKGPKVYREFQKLALLILFQRSRLSLRDFTKSLYENLWPSWLDLKEIPSYRTIHEWFKKTKLSLIRKINEIVLNEQKPKILAIDATGLDSWQRSRHYQKRINDPNMPYAKLDIIIDTETLVIHDFVLRIKPRHDTLGAKTIFKRLKKKNTLILADKGYDSEPLHELVKQSGNIMFAPVRIHKKGRPGGTNRKRCAKGNEKYNRRNTVECVMHAIKSRKNALKNKIHYMKKREIAWTIVNYNIERVMKTIKTIKTIIYIITKKLF